MTVELKLTFSGTESRKVPQINFGGTVGPDSGKPFLKRRESGLAHENQVTQPIAGRESETFPPLAETDATDERDVRMLRVGQSRRRFELREFTDVHLRRADLPRRGVPE